jgi:hypothetical protein
VVITFSGPVTDEVRIRAVNRDESSASVAITPKPSDQMSEAVIQGSEIDRIEVLTGAIPTFIHTICAMAKPAPQKQSFI